MPSFDIGQTTAMMGSGKEAAATPAGAFEVQARVLRQLIDAHDDNGHGEQQLLLPPHA